MQKDFTIHDLHHYAFLNEKNMHPNKPVRKLPGKVVMQNIFSYARALMVVQTNSAGHFDLLLN